MSITAIFLPQNEIHLPRQTKNVIHLDSGTFFVPRTRGGEVMFTVTAHTFACQHKDLLLNTKENVFAEVYFC